MLNVKSTPNIRSKHKQNLKKQLNIFRIVGLFMSLMIIVLLALQQFKIVNSIWNCVSILYSCGILFTLFAQYQDFKLKKILARFSRVIATLFYILTIILLIVIILDLTNVNFLNYL